MAVLKQPIVVGVDGAEHSRAAVSWAAQEARRRRTRLHLVLSSDPARIDYAEETLGAIAAECRSRAPDLEITEEISADHPVTTLVRRSAEAQMIVVGSRGRSGFVNALFGSVGAPLAAQSACPVIVVPLARAKSSASPPALDGTAPEGAHIFTPAPSGIPERSRELVGRSSP